MSKTEQAYSSVPTNDNTTTYVEGFNIGSSHAVTVIVDENTNRNCHQTEPPAELNGSRRPVELAMCPKCSEKHVRTRTRTYPNAATWATVAITAVVFFPVCWVPLVVDGLKQTDHFCQSCGEKIGTLNPMQGVGVKERQ